MAHARLRGAAAALALAALLAGCATPASQPSAPPMASDAPAATPTATAQPVADGQPVATAEPAASAAPAATADPTADWQLIQPESGRSQFRIPADWSADVTLEELHGEPVDIVIVRRPDGQQQLRFAHAPGDFGGSCGQAPPSELLDIEPLAVDAADATAFGAVAAELEDGRWVFGMGITGEERLQEPLGCPFRFVATGPAPEGEPGGLLYFGTESQLTGLGDASIWIVDSIEDARAYLETEEYATLKQILLSFEARV